jgi:hypothetical protein
VCYKVVSELLKKGRSSPKQPVLVADSKIQRKDSDLRQRILAEVK